MSMKHTPGPWTVHSCETHPHHEIRAEGRTIATQNDYHDGQDKANARLIAAAPTLYSLVRAWLLSVPHGEHSEACARIINEIEGEK